MPRPIGLPPQHRPDLLIQLLLIMPRLASSCGSGLTVDDADAALEELRAKGAVITTGPLTRNPGLPLASSADRKES